MNDLFEASCPCCGRPYEASQPDTSFDEFWALVPNKVGKANAEKAWRKLKPQERVYARDTCKAFYDWFAKACPGASLIHPATYLNGKRFMDDAVRPKAASADLLAKIEAGRKHEVAAVREHFERVYQRMKEEGKIAHPTHTGEKGY